MLESFTNFHFIRPWWLLLLPVVVGLWWLWQRQSDSLRGWRVQMDSELLHALAHRDGTAQAGWGRWLLVAWLLALVAVAGPAWRLEPSPFADDAAPLMVLLQAGDVMERVGQQPTSMKRAQLKIADLAEVRKGQPLGLIAYAGSAHLVLPPTRDTQVVAEMAAQISPDVMPVPGDRLDLALRKAADLLDQQATGGSLLVVAHSVDASADVLSAEAAGHYPLQFLVIAAEESPEAETIGVAATSLKASVQQLTSDDEDVTTLVHTASRRSLSSVAGESTRWQEAGFWLVPLIVMLTALSFRREGVAATEGMK